VDFSFYIYIYVAYDISALAIGCYFYFFELSSSSLYVSGAHDMFSCLRIIVLFFFITYGVIVYIVSLFVKIDLRGVIVYFKCSSYSIFPVWPSNLSL